MNVSIPNIVVVGLVLAYLFGLATMYLVTNYKLTKKENN